MLSTSCLPGAPALGALPLVTREGRRAVIWLDGEHDIATGPVLADALHRITIGGGDDVVVDLGRVTFMAAATIEVLLRGQAALAGRSRALTLRAPSATATRLLAFCGMSALIEPEVTGGSTPSRRDAMAAR